MTKTPWFEPFIVLCTVSVVSFLATMMFGDSQSFDEIFYRWNTCYLFGAAAGAIYYRLRTVYPPVVGIVTVLALLSLPHVVGVAVAEPRELFRLALVLIAWGLWPIVRLGILGLVGWVIVAGCAGFFVQFDPGFSAVECWQIPEWHGALVVIGLVATVKRHDRDGYCMIASSLLMILTLEGVVKQAMLAPIIGIAAGRLLYRGTLTTPIKIPRAGWAMVLLAIAAVRSVVIMVTWAPHWDDYLNRIGLWLQK